jgi:hypothetical protein
LDIGHILPSLLSGGSKVTGRSFTVIPNDDASNEGIVSGRDCVWYTRSIVLTLGRHFNPQSTLLGSYIDGYTDSNPIRFRRDDNRVLGSVVQNF